MLLTSSYGGLRGLDKRYEREQTLENLFNSRIYRICGCQLLGNSRVTASTFTHMAHPNVLGRYNRFFLYCFMGQQNDC